MEIDKRGVMMYKTIALKIDVKSRDEDIHMWEGRRYYWDSGNLWPQEIKFAKFVKESTENQKIAAKIILDNPNKQDIREIINSLQEYLNTEV